MQINYKICKSREKGGVAILYEADFTMIFRSVVQIMVLISAVADDIRRFRISNRIIVTGIIMAVVAMIAECFLNGTGAAADMCIGGVLAFISAFAVYALRGIGAGDVKLLFVCGLLIKRQYVWHMLGCSLIAGVMTGAVEMIFGKCVSADVGSLRFHAVHFSIGILIGNVMILAKLLL